jgi:hypothetical protein
MASWRERESATQARSREDNESTSRARGSPATEILEALRNRRSRGSGSGAEAAGSSSDEHELPISGYDPLKEKEIAGQLSQLSQVELATVETYERAHEARPVVLDKLRYMRGSEPLPGYDSLTTEQIAEALAG